MIIGEIVGFLHCGLVIHLKVFEASLSKLEIDRERRFLILAARFEDDDCAEKNEVQFHSLI